MTTLVLGASGKTGKQLVEQLLAMGQNVKLIVRSTNSLPEGWSNNAKITIIKANISEVSADEMIDYLSGCQAVASCLGHNLTFAGILGKPRKLVYDSVRLVCETITKKHPEKPIKFVLMNTAGNSNRDINEPVSVGEKIALGLIRTLVPPHTDNEQAADYLRLNIGQNNSNIQWVAVRPDNLIDTHKVTDYNLHASPTRSAIFNPGTTSRINVANFMARLITDDELWQKWKGQMPVIYNT